MLQGNPADSTQLGASLERHQQTFSAAPEICATDRGFYSAENIAACQRADVAEIFIPYRGGGISEEHSHVQTGTTLSRGMEGRISVCSADEG